MQETLTKQPCRIKRCCKKHIELKIPNPLWWIVGYLFIYPFRKIRKSFRHYRPLPKRKNYCGGCGKDDGDSVWGFCSPECLEIIHQRNKEQDAGKTPGLYCED
jgi:hypothetical protein